MKKKIKVLHVLNTLERGGAETYAYKLIKNQDATHIENFLAYTADGPMKARFEEAEVCLFQMSANPLSFRRPWTNLSGLFKLYRFIKKQRIQVIHAHLFEPYFWAFFVAFLTGVPFVRTIVSNRRDAPSWTHPFERIFARFTTAFVALTETSKTEFVDFLRIDGKKISVIPNGVECQLLEATSESEKQALRQEWELGDGPVVGNVGRLHPHKDQATFIRAAALVLKEMPNTTFVIDGDGPLREELVALAQKMGVTDRLIFTGWSQNVYALISLFDVFVLSSVTEGAPTVVIEAMGLEVPVVATRVGGVPEMIQHDKTGLVVEAQNVRKMADALILLLTQPEKAKQIALAGYQMCREHYDFPHIARNVAQIYSRF